MTAPLTYTPFEAWVKTELEERGFTPAFSPGPVNDQTLKLTPDSLVYLMIGGGPGLSLDQLYDRVIITTRCAGPQNDHPGAEALALALDSILIGQWFPVLTGQTRSLYFARTGGRPTLLLQDDADRYHFTCSYITEATTGP